MRLKIIFRDKVLNKKIHHLIMVLLLGGCQAQAESTAVFHAQVKGEFDQVYQKLSSALEAERFFVVFEPNIGANLSRFSEKWGKDYNQNGFDSFRSMVFCNPWYANKITNKDPAMTAMCPLSIGITSTGDVIDIYFERPSVIAKGGGAEEVAAQLEKDIINIIDGINP